MGALVVHVPLLLGTAAVAHRPRFSDGTHKDPDSAILIADPGLSQVVYHEVTTAAPQLWLRFEGEPGQEITLQIGLPALERVRELRPALALIGPDLPPAELPFEVPKGLGAEVFTTGEITDPRFFHEPFTGTDSWILRDSTTTLKATGTHYVVAYVPSGATGKMWAAIGTREDWGVSDLAKLPDMTSKVRRFHEVPGQSRLVKTAGGVGAVVLALLTWLVVAALKR